MFIIDSSNFDDIFGVLTAATTHWILESTQPIGWPQLSNPSPWWDLDKTVSNLELIFAVFDAQLLLLRRICSTYRQCGQVLIVIPRILLLAKFGGFYWRIWAHWHAIQILILIRFGTSCRQTQPSRGLFGRIFSSISLMLRYHRFVVHERRVVQFVERAFRSKLQRGRPWRNPILMLLSRINKCFISTGMFFKMWRLFSNLWWSAISGASFAFRVHFHDSLARWGSSLPLPRLLIVIISLVDLIWDEVLPFGDQSFA